jgi:BirA family biotin operon repressor/biotin-[acetyl-CoA-carboxylase] ligase
MVHRMPEEGARQAAAGTRFADVRRLAEVTSTNQVVADLARDGAPEGMVVVADHQTAGRGRRGRSWDAPPGSSVLVSVLLRPGATLADAPQLVSMMAGVAAVDACTTAAGFQPRLKWPNDVVVGGRKLGGILVELVGAPEAGAVVVGIGLNVSWARPFPPHLVAVAVDATEVAGRPVDRGAVLAALLVELDHCYRAVLSAGGRRELLARYRDLCDTPGQLVRVEMPDGAVVEGMAEEVGGDGALTVQTAHGRVEVRAGDVVHVKATGGSTETPG